jgi:hypothetical protein
MSGSGANLPINIRLNGTAEAEAAFNRVSTTAGTAMQRVGGATEQASGGMRNFNQAVGSAGFQLQDFVVQVQGGTSALTALSQQGSQFLGVFGTGGAVAGAALTIGLLATQILTAGDNAKEAEDRIRTAFDGIKAESEGVRDLIKEIGDLFKSAAERANDLALAQRGVLANNADLRLSNAVQLQDAAASRIPQLEREIVVLERRAAVEADLARRAGRAGLGSPVDQTTDLTSALFVARSQLNGLRAEMDLQSRRIGELNAARGALSRTGSDLGRGEFGPAAPASIEQTRQGLERDFSLRQQHAERITSINVALAAGNVSAAEAVDLRAASERKLAEDLRNLAERQTGATNALREYETLQRTTQGVLVGNASDARVAGEIMAQIRGTALDPAVRQRAEADAQRTAEREADRRNAEADRFSQNWGDRIATETTRGLFEGTRNGETAAQRFGNALRNILMSSVSAVLSRNLFQPLISSGVNAASGAGFNLLGGGTMGGAAGVADAGGLQGGLNQAGQVLGLRQAGGFGNLGNAFMGNGLANTGLGFVDGALNTPIFGSGAAMQGPTLGGAPLAGVDGLTVAGGLGGAAGILGGAYGIYSGIQRGGVGGAVGALGGAAGVVGGGLTLASGLGLIGPGLAVLGPYALAAAAVLAIASALLPGEKPSGRGQLSRINLNTENQSFEGLGGNRFSQDNRDAASNAVSGIAQLAREIGDKLGGARIGGDVAVGVTSGRGGGPGQLYLQIGANTQQFTNDEAGSKQLAETAARLILEEFRRQGTATGDYAGILAASPTAEVLSQNLEWYEKTYKALTQAAEPVSAFQQSIDQLTAQFQPAIDKARELSLSVDKMTEAREREIAKLIEQRAIQLNSFAVNLDVRRLRAQGHGEAADFLAFDLNAENERRAARQSLEAAGLTADMVAERMLWLENTLADERLAIQRSYGERTLAEQQRIAEQTAAAQIDSARTILDYLNGQAFGATSSLSPTARLAEAERQFNAALQGGDARSLTSAADALLTNSQLVFGGASQTFAQREASVRQVLLNRGNAATNEGATVAALSQMTAALTAELASLRAGFDALLAETRRTNNQAMVA